VLSVLDLAPTDRYVGVGLKMAWAAFSLQ